MLLPLLLFFHFYFFGEISAYSLESFHFNLKNIFGISCGADLLVICSVSFLLSGNYLTFLYFMDIFTGYIIFFKNCDHNT